MNAKIGMALGLLGGAVGRYTPFLSPYWDDEERIAFRDWSRGRIFPDSGERLSEAIGKYLGTGWTILPVNLGRSAIQIALQAMDLPTGSEVIVPSFACNGVAAPVLQAGHRPVFADVDAQFNLSFESVLEADSKMVRAVIVPHLSGCWNRSLDRVLAWAKERGIYVIEDAAQSLGLRQAGREAGTSGDVGIFSCNGGKQIVSSGGAWLITRHPVLAKRISELRLPTEPRESVAARMGRFTHNWLAGDARLGARHLTGFFREKLSPPSPVPETPAAIRFEAFRISDIEAYLALLQLPKVAGIIRKRTENARHWKDLLVPLSTRGIEFLPDEGNAWTKMLLAFTGPLGQRERHLLSFALARMGIECESSYVPLHLRGNYHGQRSVALPVTDRQWRGAFSLPVRPNLDDADWERIGSATGLFADSLARTGREI